MKNPQIMPLSEMFKLLEFYSWRLKNREAMGNYWVDFIKVIQVF